MKKSYKKKVSLMGKVSYKGNWNRSLRHVFIFRSSFLLLYISALHWGDCGRNTAYGGNDFFDLCSWDILQVYVLWNFDESDEISKKELLGIIICTIIYTAVSYIGKWFDRNPYVTLGFAAYIVFVYIVFIWYINAGAELMTKY